jgi:hypothetical protein
VPIPPTPFTMYHQRARSSELVKAERAQIEGDIAPFK